MARYYFILTQENREKILGEGLNLEPRMLGQKIFFEDFVQFYNSSTNCSTVFNLGGFSFSRSGSNLVSLGNYCSVDLDVDIIRIGNFPYQFFSTNTIVYQKNGGVLSPVFTSTGLDKTNKIIPVNLYPQYSCDVRLRKFRIGSDVCIKHSVRLAPDVKLATGSCIQQGAVVRQDVPPYAIVAGNPAQIVAYRFPDKIIEKLLETKWTEYDISSIQTKHNNIEQFIDNFYKYKDNGTIKPIVLKNLKEVLDKLEISYIIE